MHKFTNRGKNSPGAVRPGEGTSTRSTQANVSARSRRARIFLTIEAEEPCRPNIMDTRGDRSASKGLFAGHCRMNLHSRLPRIRCLQVSTLFPACFQDLQDLHTFAPLSLGFQLSTSPCVPSTAKCANLPRRSSCDVGECTKSSNKTFRPLSIYNVHNVHVFQDVR